MSLTSKSSRRSFTLLELIIVIVVLGILATLGVFQYSRVIENSRLAEAIMHLGAMRQHICAYYMEHGTAETVTIDDLGEDLTSCGPSSFYRYSLECTTNDPDGRFCLVARRCTSDGKAPDVSREYVFWLEYYPQSQRSIWNCYYEDNGSACFGYPSNQFDY